MIEEEFKPDLVAWLRKLADDVEAGVVMTSSHFESRARLHDGFTFYRQGDNPPQGSEREVEFKIKFVDATYVKERDAKNDSNPVQG